LRRYDKNSPAHASLTASVVIPYAGDWSVSVTQGTYNVQHFLGSPHLITVAAAATDPASCTTKLSSNLEVGGLLTASISTFDLLGNPTADPSDALTYWLNDDSTPALLDGNSVSAQVDVPGLQLLHVAVNGVEIGGSPYVRQLSKPRRAANSLHRARFAPRRYSFSVTGDLACPPGFTPVDNACMRCANGFVKLDATSAPCSACVSFVAGSVDTDPVRTPDSADSCICPTGFVLFESGCVECPEGTECAAPGVNVLTLPLEAGYWRASNESMEVLQCGEVEACTGNGTSTCAEGHRGPLCELCEEGWAMADGVCVGCGAGGSGKVWGALGAVGFVAVLLGVCGYAAYSANEKRVDGMKDRFKVLKVPVKLVLQYLQIMSMLEVSLDMKFPSIMGGLARASSASNVNFMGLAPVGCVGWGWNQDEKLLGFTSVLLVLGAAVGLLRNKEGVLQG